MGYLSQNASKAFKKGTRRAHVPDWFQPLSYVFGGLALVLLGVLYLTAGDPVNYEVVEPPAGSAAPGPGTSNGNNTSSTTPSLSTGDTELTLAGGTVRVPTGAIEMANRAARAIYTGEFSGVPIFGGESAPPVVLTWPAPTISAPRGADTFPDGSWRLLFDADPDGNGPERVRSISIFVAPENGSWAYLPG
jgi:hypothetical protein